MNDNELMVFNKEDFNRIKETKIQKYFGCFYACEIGNKIKIGYTQDPRNRLSQLKSVANYMGSEVFSIIFSVPHINYKENEKKLHNYFSNYRINGTELFNITKTKFIDCLKNNDIIYYDFDENHIDLRTSEFINALINSFNCNNVNKDSNNKIDILCKDFMKDANINLLNAFSYYSECQKELIEMLEEIRISK